MPSEGTEIRSFLAVQRAERRSGDRPQWRSDYYGSSPSSGPTTWTETIVALAIVSVLFGAFIGALALAPIVWRYFVAAIGLNAFRFWVATAATVAAGLLFRLKREWPYAYGYTELAFGLAMIWYYAVKVESDLYNLPLIGGGSYLIVRALGNLADAEKAYLKNRRLSEFRARRSESQSHTNPADSPSALQSSPESAHAGSEDGTVAAAPGR